MIALSDLAAVASIGLRTRKLRAGLSALGIAIGDRVLMQEFSVYSVIPPEGCAAILWRDANKKIEAATALKITAADMVKLFSNIINAGPF